MNFIYNLSSLFALHFLWYTIKLSLTSSKPGTQGTQSFTGNCPVPGKSLKPGIKPRMGKLLMFREKSYFVLQVPPLTGSWSGFCSPSTRKGFQEKSLSQGLASMDWWVSWIPGRRGLGAQSEQDLVLDGTLEIPAPDMQKGCLKINKGNVIWRINQALKIVKRDCHEHGMNPALPALPSWAGLKPHCVPVPEKCLSVQPESSNFHLQEHYHPVVGMIKTRGREDMLSQGVCLLCLAQATPQSTRSSARARQGSACGSCCTPDSSHCHQFLSPASCCPWQAVSACPAQSSGTLVCSQGAEDTNQSSISFPQPIVPGQGAVQPRLLLPSPAILRSPGQGASWQLQEEQNLLLAALGGRELRAHRHLPCWVWKQENPPEKQIPMQSTKWGFSLRWGKIESVQNFHGCIKKSPCEAQSGSYLEPQPWNLISPTAAAMVGRAAGFSAIIFLMDLSHFAQMNRHRNSPCSSGGQCRDSNRCPSLCSFHSSASPRLAFPALGSRSAEQKAAGLCTLKSRFQSPGAEMLVQPTQRGSEGQQRVQETQQTFSFTI